MNLKHLKRSIDAKVKDVHKRSVVIVAFGDSVTMGAMQLNETDYDAVYHARLKKLLEARYPKAVFSVINSGVGGESAKRGLKRINRDVIIHKPDLVIVGFALNDSCCGAEMVVEYGRTLEKIIRRIQKNSVADIIMLTPNFMNTADNRNVHPTHRKTDLPKKFKKIQLDGVLKSYADKICEVAAKYGLAVADTYAAWEEFRNAGVDTNMLLANGLNHPTPELHAVPAELVMNCIGPDFKVSAVKKIIRKYGEKRKMK